jgi:hypothetical protein
VEHRPHTNAAMEDAPMGSGMAESEDATEIECALRNASIGGCKDALPAFRSTDDDEDEGGGEDQVDARMSDDLSFGGVGSVGASHGSDSNLAEYSEQGHEEQHAEMEVIRRLTCRLTMLILTRMPCTTIQMGDSTPSSL